MANADVELVYFRDESTGSALPFIPSAVLYADRQGEETRYGFDALYRATEGAANLKTGFKLDLISPPSGDELRKQYRVFRDGREDVLSPREAFEDFVSYVLRTALHTIRTQKAIEIKRVGVIIGVPPIKDEGRRQEYRDRVRQAVTKGIGSLTLLGQESTGEVLLYEPFAVYSYYRDSGAIPRHERERRVLIIDWGGGTMNLSVITTTRRGEIAKGGAKAVPQSIEGEATGGRILDRRLVDLLFNNEPREFRDEVKNCHRDMLEIERAKIEVINRLKEGEAHAVKRVTVRGKTQHSGVDSIRDAFQLLWSKDIQQKIRVTMDQAKAPSVDLVLLAGGSSRIPFIRENIKNLLSLADDQIIVGQNFEQAVSCGLTLHAKETLNPSEASEVFVAHLSDGMYLLLGDQTVTIFPKDTPLSDTGSGEFAASHDLQVDFQKDLRHLAPPSLRIVLKTNWSSF
jgi:molecular chaperone DnaK (HSP70)